MFNPLDHPVSFQEPRRLVPSAWAENVPFAMLLVDLLRPTLLVELGTKRGMSYCGFCQAVEELGLPTRCFAVDLWAEGPEGSYLEFYEKLKAYHDPLYGRFSELLRMSFDDSLPRFADGSIDLLHIDGLHSYEAASHDFETWLPKMSDRGVVLLHDTMERGEGFGVWQLLGELEEQYPVFNLEHAAGLGVVAVGENARSLLPFFDMDDESRARVRLLYARLGERIDLEQRRRVLEKELKKTGKLRVELDRIKARRSYRALEPVRRAYGRLRPRS